MQIVAGILKRKFGISKKDVFSTLHWLPLSYRLLKHRLIFLSKCCHLHTPTALSNLLTHAQHGHSTRNKNVNFVLPHVKTKNGKLAFQFWGPSVWNAQPIGIKQALTLNMCKLAIHNTVNVLNMNVSLQMHDFLVIMEFIVRYQSM